MTSTVAKVAKAAAKGGKVAKGGKTAANGKAKVITKNSKVVSNVLEMPVTKYKLSIADLGAVLNDFWVTVMKNDDEYTFPLECEADDIEIYLKPERVFQLLGITPEKLGVRKTATLLSLLREHEDQSAIEPVEPVDGDVPDDHRTKQNFVEKTLYALFYLYDPPVEDEDETEDEEPIERGRYQYYRIKIAPSTIKEAGMGIYALENIPKNAVGQYKGIPRTADECNVYYSWVIKSFDPMEGDPDDNNVYMYYVDATDFARSNWTRYVNCGMKNDQNNMEQEQVYDKIFYTTTKTIKAGDEMFVDYGEEYREYNFGLDPTDY